MTPFPSPPLSSRLRLLTRRTRRASPITRTPAPLFPKSETDTAALSTISRPSNEMMTSAQLEIGGEEQGKGEEEAEAEEARKRGDFHYSSSAAKSPTTRSRTYAKNGQAQLRRRPRRFASLDPERRGAANHPADAAGAPAWLEGIVFDVDGTLWYVCVFVCLYACMTVAGWGFLSALTSTALFFVLFLFLGRILVEYSMDGIVNEGESMFPTGEERKRA